MKSLILLVPVLAVVAAKTTCNCDFTSRAVICKGLSLTEFHKKDSGCEHAFWKIDISENNLQVYPDDLQQFREVNLSLNSLEHLETSIDTEVVYLDVSKNEIVEIDLGNRFLNLQHLIVANNYLGLMDDFLVGQCNIFHLDVSGNKIKRLKTVSKCAPLTILKASGNKISQIANEIVHLTKLQVLDLSRNNIKDVSGLPTTLEILDLSSNIIQRVTDSSFRGLGSLQALDLSSNRISIIEKHSFATLRSLQSLNLRQNKLSVLSGDLFKGLTSLRGIDIAVNSIESLSNDTFSDLSALEKVTLESNEIRTLPALQFGRKLIKISFCGNSITKMDYSALLTMFSESRDERYISFLVNNFHGDDPEWSNVLKYFDGECSSGLKYATQKVLNKLNVARYTKYILDPSSCACAIFKKGKWKFTACIADGGEVDGLPWLEAAEISAGMKEDVGRPSKPWRNEF